MNDRLEFQIEDTVQRCVALAEQGSNELQPGKRSWLYSKPALVLLNVAILASTSPILPNGADGCIGSGGTYDWCF
ncbi:MAG: hypothetical protein KDE09_23580 [Anaerolineales bacterium]|nr:hypothetical protein [Anaerolineales bacterium]